MDTAKVVAGQLLSLNMVAHHATKLKERKDVLTALDAAIAYDATTTITINF